MTTARPAPATMEDLVAQYDRMVVWMIRKTLKGAASRETDVEELRQMVYLRIIQQRYLERCQDYQLRCGGSFASSLCVLVRNVVLNYLDQTVRRRRRYPQLDPRPGVHQPALLDRFDRRAEAANFLDVLEARTRAFPIKGGTLGDVLQAMRTEEVTTSPEIAAALAQSGEGPSQRRVRTYLQKLRTAAQTLRQEEARA